MGTNVFFIIFGIFYFPGANGTIDNCVLTTCEKVINIEDSTNQILRNQRGLAVGITEIALNISNICLGLPETEDRIVSAI